MVARYSIALVSLILLSFFGVTPAQEKDREYVIEGSVKAIDVKKKEVTILRTNGKETTVKFDDTSKIYIDGKKSMFDQIKEKHEVRCAYLLESKHVSQISIFVEIDRAN